jgi:iron complex outermembrane receptor protein
LARWTRALTSDSELSLQLYFDRTHLETTVAERDIEGLVIAPAGTLTDDLGTYDIDFQHRFAFNPSNEIVWGFGYRLTHNEVENAPGLAFDPPVLDHELFSVFVQNETEIAPRLHVTFGSKVEHNDYPEFEYEPSARVQWRVAQDHTLWAAVSRAVRMPSRVDRDARQPTPGLVDLIGVENILVASDTFVSETVVSYEAGYRSQLGSNVASSIAIFYNEYDNLRSTRGQPTDSTTVLPFPFFFANDLEATTYGAEVTGDVRVYSGWRVRAGYALLIEDVRVKAGGIDLNEGRNETADPEHRLSVRTSADLFGRVELDAGFRWIASFDYNSGSASETAPGYVEADARMAVHLATNFEIAVVGQDLLHEQHLEYVAPEPNVREEIRRSVHATVSYRW